LEKTNLNYPYYELNRVKPNLTDFENQPINVGIASSPDINKNKHQNTLSFTNFKKLKKKANKLPKDVSFNIDSLNDTQLEHLKIQIEVKLQNSRKSSQSKLSGSALLKNS